MSVDRPTLEEAAEPRRTHRTVMVRLAVVGTTLVFAVCAGLLIYRGLTVEVPDSMIVVRGSPAWEGAEASVDGINLARPRTAAIDRNSKHTISFHLTPGSYTLSVANEGRTVYSDEFQLTRQENIQVVQLPASPEQLPPTTRPKWPLSVNPFLLD